MGKDPLCPLGFHPQVRWPTRCKRCFRDYKEHNFSKKEESGNSNLRKDDVTGSAPTLTDSQVETYGRFRQSNSASPAPVSLTQAYNARRNTTGSLTLEEIPPEYEASEYSKVSERSEKEKDYSSIYSSLSGSAISRLNKLRPGLTKDGQTIAGSPERRRATASDRISEKLSDRAEDAEKRSKRVQIQGLKEVRNFDTDSTSPDVEFIFEVKKSSARSMATSSHEDDDELSSWAGTETTETTETTLVEGHVEDLEEQIATLRKDLDAYKTKCDRLEREKGDLLLKKIANYDTRSRNSELSKLQQRIRELETLQEDLVDDKKCAELRVKELEQELERKSQSQDSSKTIEDLRSRLLAAENVIEEFMEENEELKKEMRQMVEEMDEMQDNFREDQADEYRDIKKELEQTAKNCRIIQFKMRKAERRIEQVEAEKIDLENRLQQLQDASSSNGSPSVSQLPTQTNKMAAGSDGSKDRVQVLEHELSLAKELSLQMQKELQTLRDEVRSTDNTSKKEHNMKSGPVLSKSRSLEGTSLRHPEDTTQLIRDLQDSKEREADLREQLKFSEEEAQALRKKLSRVEEENETLVMQLKKMATKKGRRTTPDTSLDKDEGISDDMDDLSLSELKLQLELNEQETSVLRRKVEDMESENERLSREVSELQDKAKVTQNAKLQVVIFPPTDHNPNAYYDQKIRSFETEAKDLRLKLIEKDREVERLEGELTVAQKTKGKVVVQRSRSLDNSENSVDLNRKLALIEQEVAVLRTKIVDLETENEKLTSENRRLHLRVSRKPPPTSQEQLLLDKTQLEDQVHSLDKRLAEANQKVAELSAKIGSNSPRLGRLAEKGKNLGPNSTSELNVLKREIELMERGLKAKEEELAAVKSQLQAVQTQNTDLQTQIQQSRDAKPLKSRTPKIPSESMTKLQLKKMVEELEREISDLCPIPDSTTDAEIRDIRDLLRKEQMKCTELQNEKTALETKIQQIQRDVRSILPKSSAQAEELQRQLNETSKKCSDLETKLKTTGSGGDFEAVQKIKQEKHRLQKELTEKETKVSDLERKVKDCEDKIKKSERSLKEQKDQLNTIQKELEEETVKVKQADAHYKELSATWLKERDELKKQASDLKAKLEELETTVSQKEKKIKDMDASSREEAKKAVETASRKAEKDMKTAQEEVASVRSKLEEVELKLKQNEQERKALNEKCTKLEADWRREKEQWQSKNTDLELELKAEKKKRDRVEKEHDKDLQEKDEEMILMREKVKRAEQEYKNIQEKFESLKNQNTRVAELELDLERESQEYEDLTAKYELLEEDYVVIKARLVMDKEQIEEDHLKLKKEHETLEGELRTLRETFNHRQDTWIKEKLDMQEKLKELEEKLNRSSSENWQGERARLKTQLEEKTALLDKAKHEEETLQDQLTNLRKENDEVKRKLEDFDKVTKVQRSMTVDTSAHDKEIRELKNKLAQEEKAHRSEMSHVKLRHDNRLALLNEEVHSYQTHLEKARRERDTFREMLEGAQKMIAELKRDPSHQRVRSDSDAAHNKEMEDNMDKIEEFHARITGLEDELSEARMEISRLKTEAINDKSSWEIRVSEMQTKINEMEEDKVMTTGRSRIPGTKTRLELAWQKERDELQRLLQETSTLARDLRQTLFEVEKERDRERLDAKRKVEQAKKGLEEDQEEMRKKVQELQCDLLELRDAHAKLRTTCEKLRRDKDRSEKEREEMRQHMQDLRRTETDEERKVVRLLDDVQKMKDLCPLVMGAYLAGTRQESKPARETPGDKVREEFMESLRNISRTTEELKRVHRLEETDMSKRSMSFRRAMSSTPDDAATSQTNGNKRNSLYRRTQSLEQNQAIDEIESDERGSVDSVSSMGVSTPQPYSKIGSNARYSTLPTRARTVERDQSLDRLSTTSTRSEMVPATPETKKKKGLIGKIKQLTKSKSIEETTTADSIVTAGIKALMPGMGDRGSDLSLESRESRLDEKKDKKKIKDKISGFFKKGASSRTNSMERSDSFESYGPGDDPRERRSDSTQRPLARNGSNTNLAAAVTPTPAVRTPAIESRTSQSSRASITPTKQVSNPKEPEPTPGYAPSMSPLGYSALLSSTGSLPRKTRPVTDRSKTADLRPTLRHQGSQETNV